MHALSAGSQPVVNATAWHSTGWRCRIRGGTCGLIYLRDGRLDRVLSPDIARRPAALNSVDQIGQNSLGMSKRLRKAPELVENLE